MCTPQTWCVQAHAHMTYLWVHRLQKLISEESCCILAPILSNFCHDPSMHRPVAKGREFVTPNNTHRWIWHSGLAKLLFLIALDHHKKPNGSSDSDPAPGQSCTKRQGLECLRIYRPKCLHSKVMRIQRNDVVFACSSCRPSFQDRNNHMDTGASRRSKRGSPKPVESFSISPWLQKWHPYNWISCGHHKRASASIHEWSPQSTPCFPREVPFRVVFFSSLHKQHSGPLCLRADYCSG